MKKSLIALAVAGAFAAPAMAATSNVDVYGIMSVAIQDTNAAGNEIQVTDNASRIGFKGSEDLGGGLKAIWQIESQLNGTGNDGLDGGGTVGGRNTFVGLAGGFGTFLMGRHDTPYKLGTGKLDIFADTIGDYNGRAINGVTVDPVNSTHDHRSGNAIAYVSPTWSGFHFAVAVVAGNDAAAFDNANKTFDATSFTAVYENGPLFGSLSYQKVNDASAAAGEQDFTGTKLGLGYTMGDTKFGFVYENLGGTAAGTRDDGWLLNVAHTMGPIVLKAQYGKYEASSTTDPSKWDLGVDYNLSKRTTAYFVYSDVDNDAGTDGHGYNIGIKHSF